MEEICFEEAILKHLPGWCSNSVVVTEDELREIFMGEVETKVQSDILELSETCEDPSNHASRVSRKIEVRRGV